MPKHGEISPPDQGGGTASVAPLFGRSLRIPTRRCAREQQERAVSAVGRAGRGDADGLSYLYRQFAPRVFAYVRRILANDYDAQDVTQQVFVKLATSLDKYDSQRADFSAWILRVAHNAAVDYLRKDRLELPSDPIEAPPGAEESDHWPAGPGCCGRSGRRRRPAARAWPCAPRPGCRPAPRP